MGCFESKEKLTQDYDAATDPVLVAFHNAVRKNDIEAVKEFLAKGDLETDILQYLSTDPSRLEKDTVTMANLLISHGANVNCTNDQRFTPLHYAVSTGQPLLTKCLLENGAKVNQRNLYNEIPLHHACARADTTIAKILLENKSKINEVSRFGTPLHYVCADEHPTEKTKQMCEFLLDSGADIKIQCDIVLMPSGEDRSGQHKVAWTPLHVAYWAGNTVCAEVLKQRGADKDNLLNPNALRAEWSQNGY